MKVISILVLCLVSLKCTSAQANKRSIAFQSIQKCAKEHGLDYKTVSSYVKGDFTNETKEVKNFMKCVAHDMKFWDAERPQKEIIMGYVPLLVKDIDGASDIIDKCIATDVSDDFSDHLYNVYKCFWTEAMTQSNRKNQLSDFCESVKENE